MYFNPQPKIKVIRDPRYLAWIRKKYPVALGQGRTEAAHKTIKIPSSKKGMGQKNHDIWTLPEAWEAHCLEHAGNLKVENEAELIVLHIIEYKHGDEEFFEDVLNHITINWKG